MNEADMRELQSRPSYTEALTWILTERPTGGWPPREIKAVSGWLVVRMVAYLFRVSVAQVAQDLITLSLDYCPQQDTWGSVEEAYDAIRERQAKGGAGWEPK